MSDGPAPYGATWEKAWWENRWLLLGVLALLAVPLLVPVVPPFTDLPGHIGRYRVQLDLETSPYLARYFTFEWALIGNLGVDLLVQALAPLMGLERAVKAIVIAIPVLTGAGALLVAREVHGRIPPSAFWALPLAYNYPLLFGFVNFALSMALALLGLGLWLRLDRQGRHGLRAAIFVPFSLVLWTCHVFGWGLLGAAALSAEVVRAWDRGARPWWKAIWQGGLAVLPLTPPFLLMLLWRSDAVGVTTDWFNWRAKYVWLLSVLRDRWMNWDFLGLGVLVALLVLALFNRRLRWSRNLVASALFVAMIYALLPRIVFGSAYADMRLAPYLLMLAVLAIRLGSQSAPRFATALAIGGLLFTGARIATNTASFLQYDARYRAELAALDQVRPGAAVVALVGKPCPIGWAVSRLDHLPSMAIARRHAFANDQWVMPGAQLIGVRYAPAGAFAKDPSQIVTHSGCRNPEWRSLDRALRAIPRSGFDYLWLIDPVPYDTGLTAGLQPVWRNGRSALFALGPQPSSATSDTPTGSDTRPTR